MHSIIAITFDDGYENNASVAAPIDVAKELTDQLSVTEIHAEGDYRFMSWDQARKAVQGGIEVGAHTISHPILTKLPFEKAAAEFIGNRDRIRTKQASTALCFFRTASSRILTLR